MIKKLHLNSTENMNAPILIQEDINYRLDNGYHWRYCHCVRDRKRCYSILCAWYNQKIPDKVQSLFYTFATPIADKIFRNIWYRQLTLKTSRQNMVHGRFFPNTRMTDCHIPSSKIWFHNVCNYKINIIWLYASYKAIIVYLFYFEISIKVLPYFLDDHDPSSLRYK